MVDGGFFFLFFFFLGGGFRLVKKETAVNKVTGNLSV